MNDQKHPAAQGIKADEPAPLPSPVKGAPKNISVHTVVGQLKVALAELVNENLDMAIGVIHLVQIDLERQYLDQMRYAEIKAAQAIAEEIQQKNKAAAAEKAKSETAAPAAAEAAAKTA